MWDNFNLIIIPCDLCSRTNDNLPGVLPTKKWDLTDRQREILDIVSSTEDIPFRQIRERLSDPPADRTIRDDLAFLKGMGLIGSKGFGRGAVWYLVKKEAENKAE